MKKWTSESGVARLTEIDNKIRKLQREVRTLRTERVDIETQLGIPKPKTRQGTPNTVRDYVGSILAILDGQGVMRTGDIVTAFCTKSGVPVATAQSQVSRVLNQLSQRKLVVRVRHGLYRTEPKEGPVSSPPTA